MQFLAVAQLQMLCIGGEIALEVGYWHTVGVLVIYAQAASYVDVFHPDVALLKPVLQFVDAVA